MKAARLFERGRAALIVDVGGDGDVVSFARTVSETFGTRVVGIVVGVLTLTITSRLLGPVGRGQFAVIMATVALVVQLSNLGLPASATYFLSRDPGSRPHVLGLFVWFSALVVPSIAAAFYGTATRGLALQSIPHALLVYGLLSAPPATFVLLAGNAFLGLGRPRWFNGLDLGVKFIGLATVLLLFWYPLSAFLIAYGTLHLGLALVAFVKLRGDGGVRLPSADFVRRTVGYGLRAYLVTLFMFLVLRIDLFLVNSIRGTADAGRYSVAVQVGEIVSLAAASIGAVAFPRLSAMEDGQRWSATRRLVRSTALLLGFGALAIGASARFVFSWFGPSFEPGVVALWWLLPGLWFLGINTVLSQHLAASGMPWFLVWAAVAGAVLNVGLNLVLIPHYGIVGASIASSCTYGTLLALTMSYVSGFWTS